MDSFNKKIRDTKHKDIRGPETLWPDRSKATVLSLSIGGNQDKILSTPDYILTSPILFDSKTDGVAGRIYEDPKPISLRRTPKRWTEEEDAALLKLIETGGLREAAERGLPEVWIELADLLNNGRTNKQCRDRFQNHLRTGIKKGNWTKEEIKLIEDMYKSFGSKWSSIAQILTHRTENDVKNKWYAMKRVEERKTHYIEEFKSQRASCRTSAPAIKRRYESSRAAQMTHPRAGSNGACFNEASTDV